jgi:hypothetical protein
LYLVSVNLLDLLSDHSAQAIEVLLLDSSIDGISENLDKVTTYLKLQFFNPTCILQEWPLTSQHKGKVSIGRCHSSKNVKVAYRALSDFH